MSDSTRGAARISAVWMITVLVLFFAAVAFAFVAYSDAAKANEAADAARTEASSADALAEEAREARRTAAVAVGWTDPESPDPTVSVTAMQADLELLRGTFPGLEDASTLQDTVQPMIAAIRAANTKIAELETRNQTLQGDLDSARSALDDVRSSKDAEIASLNQQIGDVQTQSQSQIDNLEQRIGNLTADVSSTDVELRNARTDAQAELDSKDETIAQLEFQIQQMRSKLDFIQPGKADLPDGSVIEASKALGIGYIDIGKNQRVATGLRFKVLNGKRGAPEGDVRGHRRGGEPGQGALPRGRRPAQPADARRLDRQRDLRPDR